MNSTELASHFGITEAASSDVVPWTHAPFLHPFSPIPTSTSTSLHDVLKQVYCTGRRTCDRVITAFSLRPILTANCYMYAIMVLIIVSFHIKLYFV